MPPSTTGMFAYPPALVIQIGMMTQEIERRDCPCTRCCGINIATTVLASDAQERRCDTCGFTWNEPYLRLKPDRRRQPGQLLAKPIVEPIEHFAKRIV